MNEYREMMEELKDMILFGKVTFKQMENAVNQILKLVKEIQYLVIIDTLLLLTSNIATK